MTERKYTLSDFLRSAAETFPDRTAVYFEDRIISYRELDEMASRFASGLLKAGIQKGDRVGLYMPNYPEWVTAFFGIARMGGVIVPMNTRYRGKEVDYIMNNSEATGLVMSNTFLSSNYVEIVDTVWSNIPKLKKVVVLGDQKTDEMDRFEDIIESGKDHASHEELQRIEEEIKEEDAVFILYTSGTTGEPKGAMLSNLNIAKNAEQIAQVMNQNEKDNTLIVVPFFHCFGCVIGITASVGGGSGMVPMPSFNADEGLMNIEKFGVSIVHGVPTMFIEYLEVLKKKKFDMTTVRTGVMAGAPCPVEVMKGASDVMGANIVIAYGLTEASPVITMTRLDDELADRVETVGYALPEQDVRIVDDDHNEVPRGETGELCVKGYNVMIGYFKKPEATAEAIDRDGWLYSGDLSTMDERGYVKIVGRKKDMYISGGFNVYPRELEEYLFTHPDVENVSVIGVPDPKFGEVGMAVIKRRTGSSVKEEDIISFCKGNIANFKVPRYVWFVDEYPMTQSGKIQKFRLQELAKEKYSL
jgi:acyl-CoA synthetase (AMP-forming)/AMP-acid ligase II